MNRMQESAGLRDTLEACVFFATSMGRLGGDFSAQLAPLFEPKMVSLVTNQWREGANQFQETLTVCRDAGVALPLLSLTALASAIGTTPEQPPRQLLAYPPLARLVNSYLVGLNELRRCLLPGIFALLRKDLQKSLSSVKAILDTNQRAVNAPGMRGEATELREVALQMITVWEELVNPYLRGALEVALGNFEVAKEFILKSQKFNEEKQDDMDEEKSTLDVGEGQLSEDSMKEIVAVKTPVEEEETPHVEDSQSSELVPQVSEPEASAADTSYGQGTDLESNDNKDSMDIYE